MQVNGKFGGFSVFQVGFINVSAVFKNQLSVFARWPHHIEILKIGDLFYFFRVGIVAVNVKFQIAIGSKEYFISKPCWPLVGAGKIGNLLRNIFLQVVNPKIGSAATFVSFPRAEFAVNRSEAQFSSIRRKSGKSAVYNLQRFFQSTVDIYQEIFTVSFSPDGTVSTNQNIFTVGCPVEHHIVETTTWRHHSHRVVVGELFWCSAFGRHYINLPGA